MKLGLMCVRVYLFYLGSGSRKEVGRPSIGFSYLPLQTHLITSPPSAGPWQRPRIGLRGPGSRSVEGEPDGLFSLFSRL